MSVTDPELRKRIEAAEKRQRRPGLTFPLLHDPIEDEEPTAQIIKQVRERADSEVDRKFRRGRCHGIWRKMRDILKDEHGIIWFSPAEMNPKVVFD